MNRAVMAGMVMLLASPWVAAGRADTGKPVVVSGMGAFEEHCAECHPQGGNIANPLKTLGRKDREANGVGSAADIVAKMRNPGPGMTRFDETALSAAEAGAIAEYVLKTFR
jgi:cytochrome c6